jgi:hypothetical protein
MCSNRQHSCRIQYVAYAMHHTRGIQHIMSCALERIHRQRYGMRSSTRAPIAWRAHTRPCHDRRITCVHACMPCTHIGRSHRSSAELPWGRDRELVESAAAHPCRALRPKLEGKPAPVVPRTPPTPCATLRARGCSAGGAPPETQKPTPVPTNAPTRPPPTPSPTTPATMRPTSLAPTFSALIDPCAYQNDGICDVPSYCTVGDYLDCSTDPRGLLGTALPRSPDRPAHPSHPACTGGVRTRAALRAAAGKVRGRLAAAIPRAKPAAWPRASVAAAGSKLEGS